MRVNFQEWPLGIKAQPVEKFGDSSTRHAHSFATYAIEWGTLRVYELEADATRQIVQLDNGISRLISSHALVSGFASILVFRLFEHLSQSVQMRLLRIQTSRESKDPLKCSGV